MVRRPALSLGHGHSPPRCSRKRLALPASGFFGNWSGRLSPELALDVGHGRQNLGTSRLIPEQCSFEERCVGLHHRNRNTPAHTNLHLRKGKIGGVELMIAAALSLHPYVWTARSIGLHGVPIAGIPLQSGSLLSNWQAQEKNPAGSGSDSAGAQTRSFSPDFGKLWFQCSNSANL
jgi:hypothetical protein